LVDSRRWPQLPPPALCSQRICFKYRTAQRGNAAAGSHVCSRLISSGPRPDRWLQKFLRGCPHLAFGAGDVDNAQLAKGVRQPQVLVASTHPTPRTGSEERWIGFHALRKPRTHVGSRGTAWWHTGGCVAAEPCSKRWDGWRLNAAHEPWLSTRHLATHSAGILT
jgi:hypothetical protein